MLTIISAETNCHALNYRLVSREPLVQVFAVKHQLWHRGFLSVGFYIISTTSSLS